MRRGAIPISLILVLSASCGDSQSAGTAGSGSNVDETPPETPTESVTTRTTPTEPSSPPSSIAPRATAPAPDQTSVVTGATDDSRVDRGGVAFELPGGWTVADQVVATEFAMGADCVAATIVDFEPPDDPADAGEAGFRLQSTVQICSRSLDGRTLDEFVDDTYGDRSSFEPIELAGHAAYRWTTDAELGTESVSFVQTDARRYQIVTSVAADADVEPARLAQVAHVVSSLSLP